MQNYVTKVQKEPEESILYLSTMTFGVRPNGLEGLSELLKNPKIERAFRAHLSSLMNIGAIGTYSITNSLNGYTISSFVEGNHISLAILQKQEPGLPELVTQTAPIKEKSNFWRLVIWLIVLIFFMNLMASMNLIKV